MRTALPALASLILVACPKPQGDGPTPSASASSRAAVSAAPSTTAGAASTAADAGPKNERAVVEQATAAFEEIESLVSQNTLKDPKKPDDPDAEARCATFATMRAKLEARPEPEVKKMLDDAKRVCALDVPLLVAGDALNQLGFSGSQASKQLSCNVASRELEKARAVKADDVKLRAIDGRFRQLCR